MVNIIVWLMGKIEKKIKKMGHFCPCYNWVGRDDFYQNYNTIDLIELALKIKLVMVLKTSSDSSSTIIAGKE